MKLTHWLALVVLTNLSLASLDVARADAPATREGGPHAPPPDTARSASPQQRLQSLSELYSRLAKATSDADATAIRTEIRQLWRQTGSATIDLLLARDGEAALANDPAVRRQLLEAAAKLAPDSAEVWNRRANLDFSDQRYDAALADLGHALALEPNHFDALEALAGILKDTDRNTLALKAYRRLKAINPLANNLQSAIDELARKVEGQRI